MVWFSSHTKSSLNSRASRIGTEPEKWTLLVFLPILGSLLFYLLPDALQQYPTIQFLPQVLAYIGLGMWASVNRNLPLRLGVQTNQLKNGIQLGCMVGIVLGISNTAIILKGIPALRGDITFLAQTPHAQVPTAIMLPWMIVAIATAVELNFRGFLLGRLMALFSYLTSRLEFSPEISQSLAQTLAIITSAFLFAFDPFMVATFQHLHWIAVWDGIIWAWMWVRFRNLYATIVAHAIEVIILYTCVKIALT